MWYFDLKRWALVMAAVLTAGLAAAADSVAEEAAGDEIGRAAGTVEYWYRLDVDGTPAGWMLSREVVRGDRLTTVSRLHMRFKRAGAAQILELESRFVETLGGRPLTAWSRQTLGPTPVETTWKFLPKEVLADVTHGDESRRQRLPLPARGWFTPGQIQPQLRRHLADGARNFTLSTIDPQLGLEIVDTEWIQDVPEEEVLIDGAAVSTRRFRQRQSLMPRVETVVNVTFEGLMVRSTTTLMGLEMTAILSRREDVLKGRDAPDLLVRTFIYPDRPIESPRRLRRALYEIQAEDGLMADLPSTGAQRVETTLHSPPSGGSTLPPSGGKSVRVLVEVGSSPHLSTSGTDLEPYLRSSTFVDHQGQEVRRLLPVAGVTAEASHGAPSGRLAAEQAETLRAFVGRYLRDKNLDSILATAGEVAASRSGDCTEHSVLLTALLRAAGIPARLVTGLVYVGELAGARDLFGYHMWTQAWIDNHWIDLDATLEVPFDAAHIAFGTTALNDDQATLKELARLAAFIGRARIRVLEVAYD